mmetsp:Transcript_18102/g.37254  ORF Transcript_18102/g.37254 Transcript_18102/m.37254 type:complete len:343 (-) Transcript_18102:240-1268(-)
MKLRAVGLCGVDDSVHPKQLVLYAHLYPFVEFGVLFRPDKEGQPRYPSQEWVRLLSETVRVRNKNSNSNTTTIKNKMKLAAHLCERRVDEVLRGDDTFVQQLHDWGFGRVQINATAVNGVDTSVFHLQQESESELESEQERSRSQSQSPSFVQDFLSVVRKHPELEFILQKNDETKPLWEGVLKHCDCNQQQQFPSNISMLVDESKGTGVLPKHWPPIPPLTPYSIGYAGGIGPDNIGSVLDQIEEANTNNSNSIDTTEPTATADATTGGPSSDPPGIWIDMESSLRTTTTATTTATTTNETATSTSTNDTFDLDKCFRVILAVCDDKRLFSHPSFLLENHE